MDNDQDSEVFHISKPTNSDQVLQLYAVSAKVVCSGDKKYNEMDAILQHLKAQLKPPETFAADRCQRTWEVLRRSFEAMPEQQWVVVSQRYLQNLEGLSQRLDSAPLPAWDALPEHCEVVGHTEPPTDHVEATCLSCAEAIEQANILRQSKAEQELDANDVTELLRKVNRTELGILLQGLVGQGYIPRGAVEMLSRWIRCGNFKKKISTTMRRTLLSVGAAMVVLAENNTA